MCQWLKEDGVDAIHVSSGSSFPHPKNPAGDLPIDELRKTYDSLISSGVLALRNYLLFTGQAHRRAVQGRWETARGPKDRSRGSTCPMPARSRRRSARFPVLCTGGFQTAAIIEEAIARGDCDAVTIARPLIANNDLVQQFARGIGRPGQPVHLLQQVPGQRARESARLLRREPVPVARRDGPGDSQRLPAADLSVNTPSRHQFRRCQAACLNSDRRMEWRSEHYSSASTCIRWRGRT